ncbi:MULTISPECIES: hypothetical protein [Enterobacter]|uniref:hypothetical protein n=1 Tax=Enterobacter TaxID=547 RepID=UPI00077BC291|nr:hypothetical protein [Enterobacter pseudoroggenkampii]WJW85456.1 hypothetical protein QVH39_19875 [Enterobacter pseudoroggenkampii]
MNVEYKITLWAVACGYAIICSFFYSWAFWSVFNINILQFSSFSELFPSILYTIAIPCILVILMLFLLNIWDDYSSVIINFFKNLIAPITKYLEIIRIIGLAIVAIANIIKSFKSVVYTYKEPNEFENIPWEDILQISLPLLIAAIAIYFIYNKTTFFSNLKFRRKFVVFLFCLIPAACYLIGHKTSTDILNGKDTLLVESDGQCKGIPTAQYRYISSVADKAFAMSLQDNSICIFKYNSLKLTPEKHTIKMEALHVNSI